MTYFLEKYSLPNDWGKTFETKFDAAVALRNELCQTCIDEITWDGKTVVHDEDIRDMLSTPCGCEYGFDPL